MTLPPSCRPAAVEQYQLALKDVPDASEFGAVQCTLEWFRAVSQWSELL
jgi:hypothetical protein